MRLQKHKRIKNTIFKKVSIKKKVKNTGRPFTFDILIKKSCAIQILYHNACGTHKNEIIFFSFQNLNLDFEVRQNYSEAEFKIITLLSYMERYDLLLRVAVVVLY